MTSTSTPVTMVRSLQGDTLSAIVWRYIGRSSGNVEAVLDANPELANLPPVLPAGVQIRIPQLTTTTTAPAALRLWD